MSVDWFVSVMYHVVLNCKCLMCVAHFILFLPHSCTVIKKELHITSALPCAALLEFYVQLILKERCMSDVFNAHVICIVMK
ncbi:hypothetical protein GDO86_006363 [Hymenochirus boettgeri]|uniref:Uncharacterized protein n=1 Tax=Hymenochirus boettgeri TaxID=247094 RepID=A0A8T2J896_9PIPI|nr:hypothetical protein GDO86_006363 [Hymenochirus boettgeri]